MINSSLFLNCYKPKNLNIIEFFNIELQKMIMLTQICAFKKDMDSLLIQICNIHITLSQNVYKWLS